MTRKTLGLFLDRDGTINEDLDYLSDPDRLRLIPGAARAIKEANEFGIKVFVITNQSGVARGLYSETDVRSVHRRLQSVLEASGATIDAFFYCPHHPDYGLRPYRKVCSCRKPNTGMLLEARAAYGIDLTASFVVGDKCTDIQTGKNAGCGTVLVLTGYGETEREECGKHHKPDSIAPTLYEAWQYIKKRIEHTS